MGKAFQSPDVLLVLRPALEWALRCSFVVCLCVLTTSADARPVTSKTEMAAYPSIYQRALDRFHHQDFPEALHLLDRLPNNAETDLKARADILNLRAAIYLRQNKFEKARPLFTQAIALDADLWAARFNLAETYFRQKHYADSQQQFDALLGRTSRSQQPDEWRLVQYKMLFSMLLNGQEGDLNKELDRLAKERKPALGYYYLRAAVESQQNHATEAQKWLAQASAAYPLDEEQAYAESFKEMGWSAARSSRLIAASKSIRPKPMPVLGPDASPVAVALVKEPPLPLGVSPTGNSQNLPTTLAMLQLMPASSHRQSNAQASNHSVERTTTRFSVERPAEMTPNFRYGDTTIQPPVRDEAPSETMGSTPPQFATSDDLPIPDEAVEDTPQSPVNQGMLVLARKPVAKKPSSNSNSSAASSPPAPDVTASPSVSVPSTPDNAKTAQESASPAPDVAPTPAPPLQAFLEKYEVALIKYTGKDYAAAAAALDEADKIQKNQPSSIELRKKIFAYYYRTAYNKYLEKDYTGAQSTLNEADAMQADQPDSLNLHGLIMSRQRDYDEAEKMFAKAVKADPGFWAAKFNMAELPFTRRNYTEARRRYEKLLAETDPVKQQREAELTQFKVFLTLLLEGKETAARDFMEHFKFTGATPARYYCQAALEFYGGSTPKAQEWVASAKKDYPAQIEAIFADSFYRVGWLTDPNARSSTAVAAASPSPASGPEATPGTGATALMAAASPAASPFPTPSASLPPGATSPAAVAAVSPSPSPAAAVVLAQASPSPHSAASGAPAASPKVAVVASSPATSPATVVSGSQAPSAAATTVVAAAASPAKTTAEMVTSGSPATSASATPVSVAKTTNATAAATIGPVAEASPNESPVSNQKVVTTTTSPDNENKVRLLLGAFMAVYLLGSWLFVVRRALAIKKKRKTTLRYSGRKTAAQTVEVPR